MKEEKKKKFFTNFFKFIVLILILIILYTILSSTYSKYLTQNDYESDYDMLNWHILVNDQDIKENADFTNTLTLQFDSNENIADGVVVPTSKGYFTIEIDSTGTEVPFYFDITFPYDGTEYYTIPDFKVTGIYLIQTEDNGNETEDNETETNENETEENISSSEEQYIIEPADDPDTEVVNTFKIYVEWYDEDDNELDNFNDVAATKQDEENVYIPVKLTVTQYNASSTDDDNTTDENTTTDTGA